MTDDINDFRHQPYEWHEVQPWRDPDDPMYETVSEREQREQWGWTWGPHGDWADYQLKREKEDRLWANEAKKILGNQEKPEAA